MKYGNKRDYRPIEVWHKLQWGGNGVAKTTTWSPTLAHARGIYAKALGVSVKAIGAEYATL